MCLFGDSGKYGRPAVRHARIQYLKAQAGPVSYTHLDVYKRQPVHRLETGVYAEKGLKVNNVDIINIGCGAERPLCGVQTGIGIYADTPAASPNTEDVLIQNVTLSDFQKAGLVIKTTGDVLIENTVITGSGATDIIAQNGIQINNTENAVINNSVVSDINYTGDVNACGVLLVGGAQAQVNDCTFEDVKQNVSCYDDECAAYVKDGDEVTVITTQHQAVMTPEKAPGCTEDGNKAYWYCAHCDKYFGDAELTAVSYTHLDVYKRQI